MRLVFAAALGLLVMPTGMAHALDLRVAGFSWQDRLCCIHPGEVCPTVMTPLPPTTHARNAFEIVLENVGGNDAPGPIQAVLSGSAPGLAILNAEATYPTLLVGGSAPSVGLFVVQLEDWAACPAAMAMALTLTDAVGDSVVAPFALPVDDCGQCRHGAGCDARSVGAASRLLMSKLGSARIGLTWLPAPGAEVHDLWEADALPPVPRRSGECQDVAGAVCDIADPPLALRALRSYTVIGRCR